MGRIARENPAERLARVAERSEAIVLHEGLPHHTFEAELLSLERRTKLVHELNGYPFYAEPLSLRDEDAARLTEILTSNATFQPFHDGKLCGGFHPDYAVEWRTMEGSYRVLICFGCGEVESFGPGLASRNDIDRPAEEALRTILAGYRHHRPIRKRE